MEIKFGSDANILKQNIKFLYDRKPDALAIYFKVIMIK